MVKNSKIRRCAGEKRKKERYESDGEMGVLWTGKEQRVLGSLLPLWRRLRSLTRSFLTRVSQVRRPRFLH